MSRLATTAPKMLTGPLDIGKSDYPARADHTHSIDPALLASGSTAPVAAETAARIAADAAEAAARIAADAAEAAARQAADALKQDLSAKGVANGYASLDAGGQVPLAQIPATPPDASSRKREWFLS